MLQLLLSMAAVLLGGWRKAPRLSWQAAVGRMAEPAAGEGDGVIALECCDWLLNACPQCAGFYCLYSLEGAGYAGAALGSGESQLPSAGDVGTGRELLAAGELLPQMPAPGEAHSGGGAAPASSVRGGDARLTHWQRALRAAFYVCVNAMNLISISAVWGRCAEAFPPAAAQRLFGTISAGGLDRPGGLRGRLAQPGCQLVGVHLLLAKGFTALGVVSSCRLRCTVCPALC